MQDHSTIPLGFCQCGCGKPVSPKRRFVHGHNGYKGTLAERFWAKVDKNGPIPAHCPELGPCWIWTASKTKRGYGKFSLPGGGWILAHRFAYTIVFGTIPDGMNVCHHCDNPSCENPNHFFTGSDLDNTHDRMRKGRKVYVGLHWTQEHPERLQGDKNPAHKHPENMARGENHGLHKHPERAARGMRNGAAKLTDADVLEIRRRHDDEGLGYRHLARMYGVWPATIQCILNHQTWKHI